MKPSEILTKECSELYPLNIFQDLLQRLAAKTILEYLANNGDTWDTKINIFSIMTGNLSRKHFSNFVINENVTQDFIALLHRKSTFEMLFDEMLEVVKAKNDEEGEGWSDDSYEIAKFVTSKILNRLNAIETIMDKGTRNRTRMKQWENKILDICKGKKINE